MKAEHRHELKTNELADWLTHLPEWARKNISTLVIVATVIVVSVSVYLWKGFSQKASAQEQIQLTTLTNEVLASRGQILNAAQQGQDLSLILLQPTSSLESFATTTDDDNMAAMALIKSAEALRAELHYRPVSVEKTDISTSIDRARKNYDKALARASDNPVLKAAAQFGIGLCEEDLGNYDQAGEIYKQIVANPEYKATVAAAQAQYRLDTMDSYKKPISFKPNPIVRIPLKQDFPIQIAPADGNQPIGAQPTIDANAILGALSGIPQIDGNQPVEPNVSLAAPAIDKVDEQGEEISSDDNPTLELPTPADINESGQ